MQVWTQAMFDAASMGGDGTRNLGTGDFRAVEFGGKHRVVIGPHSILGDDVRLGGSCEIGHHTEIGKRFLGGRFLIVGAHVRFGERAIVGQDAKIEGNCTFGHDCRIGEGSQIGDDVVLPESCMLFGVPEANGKTLVKVSGGNGPTMYAFIGLGEGDQDAVYVAMQYNVARRIEEYERVYAMTGRATGKTKLAKDIVRKLAYFSAIFGNANKSEQAEGAPM